MITVKLNLERDILKNLALSEKGSYTVEVWKRFLHQEGVGKFYWEKRIWKLPEGKGIWKRLFGGYLKLNVLQREKLVQRLPEGESV